jgi:hypothetical protein
VRAWVVDRRPLDELYEPFPFIDHTRRSLARVAAALRLAPPVRVVIERDVGYELWAYGDRRSCRVDVGDTACACAFLVVQSQVAGVVVPEPEVAGAVAAWTQERVALAAAPHRPFHGSAEHLISSQADRCGRIAYPGDGDASVTVPGQVDLRRGVQLASSASRDPIVAATRDTRDRTRCAPGWIRASHGIPALTRVRFQICPKFGRCQDCSRQPYPSCQSSLRSDLSGITPTCTPPVCARLTWRSQSYKLCPIK